MTWVAGQRGSTFSKLTDGIKVEKVADIQDSHVAIQRDLNRLKKGNNINIMQFKRKIQSPAAEAEQSQGVERDMLKKLEMSMHEKFAIESDELFTGEPQEKSQRERVKDGRKKNKEEREIMEEEKEKSKREQVILGSRITDNNLGLEMESLVAAENITGKGDSTGVMRQWYSLAQFKIITLCPIATGSAKSFVPILLMGPLQGVALTKVLDLVLGLVELHEVPIGPLLKLVQIPLDVILSFRCVNSTTQPGVVCKLAEGALDPCVCVIDNGIK
ncbi:hypothetical protein BTVI_20654 [Pitangus sulphuratus]|nr:hypothetical protein BTVI_20654 [Pitangus sulphuratus]